MSRGRALSELDAEITSVSTGEGAPSVRALLMDCPVEGHRHSQLVPFHDGPAEKVGERLVWHRASGSTIGDLTLTPSFLVQSCGLHGYVTAGRWVDC